MAVTAESSAQFKAFRRLTYSLSQQLSRDDVRGIIHIHFYDQQEALQNASTLDILCKLESSGIATSSNPEKLVRIMKDIKRNDLVSEVKDFMKKRKSKSRRSQLTSNSSQEDNNESEADLILRNTLEAAFVQATVLLQHMEMIQKSTSGPKIARDILKEIVTQAAQTAEVLAERLRQAEVKLTQEEQHQEVEKMSSLSLGESRADQGTSSPKQTGYINSHESESIAIFMG